MDPTCVIFTAASTSVLTMQRGSKNGCLPVEAVQKIVKEVSKALNVLHDYGIMYGGVKPENVVFGFYSGVDIKSLHETGPRPTVVKVKKYSTVRSQPLPHTYTYEGKKARIADWQLNLVGFGHAQQYPEIPEKDYDYCSAPETLLHDDPTCSLKTDIWMLGCMAFSLLTGASPFHSKRTASKTIAHMSDVLGNAEGPDPVPEGWLADRNMKDYAAVAAGGRDHNYVVTLEEALTEVLDKDELDEGALSFITGCLRVDPEKRMSAEEASSHTWLRKVDACSCVFSR